jgi:hypothetical protein
MTANHDSIIAYLDEKFSGLKEWLTSAHPGTTACEAEGEIFTQVCEIGRSALAAFFSDRSLEYRSRTSVDPADAQCRMLAFNSVRRGLYYSVFGTIEYRRSYYCGEEHGHYPLDAALNVPPTGASDFLRTMLEALALHMSYEQASAHIAKYFPVATSTRALQTAILTDSADAEGYYDQAPAPPGPPEATILAVQADCAGVPMVNRTVCSSEPCRDKGPKQHDGRMKMATAVSVSTHVPFVRTAEQVVESLFADPGEKRERMTDKEGLVFKRVWATLMGKEEAFDQGKKWVGQIDTSHVTDYVCLTDGERALQRLADEKFSGYARVLDFRHAAGYLHKAADAQFGAKNDTNRLAWVRKSALLILQGKTPSVIAEMEEWSHRTNKKAIWQPLETAANYFKRNLSAMRYDQYLAAGWPIATGLIEGCCGHVVKGRCDGTGRRWTQEGAEAMLRLSCIEENGDWDTYHDFRMQRRHQKAYGYQPEPQNTMPETNVYNFNTKVSIAAAI